MATFNQLHSDAWATMGIGTKEKPAEVFPKFKKQDFEDLKSDYVNQYGYTVRVPGFSDIVHLVPNALKSEAIIKAEKKENLVRILESPAPEWARDFATAMTWIDDIQDTSSIIFPMVRMLARIAPKAMSKLLPVFGWLLAGFDLLNVLNAIGRAPLTGMRAKRDVCKYFRQNPFSKKANYQRVQRIKDWKPGMADLIQVLQVTDQYTGVGLSLGGVMGAITDSIFGAYRYMNGEPVKFSFDPPDVSTLGMMGARGLSAANAISTQGQTFTELTHFWTYMTAAMSALALAGEFRDNDLAGLVVNPMDMMIPAPGPRDPLTIAVIEEYGLSVEDGIRWPFNGKKFISAADYIDATAEPCRASFVNYCSRHSKDWYGWLAALSMDSLIPHVILSIDPEADYFVDDTDEMKLFWKMVKAPLLPAGPLTKGQGDAFFSWAKDYTEYYGKNPGILEIEEKFKSLGIQYITSYPATPGPDFDRYWPEGWSGEEEF